MRAHPAVVAGVVAAILSFLAAPAASLAVTPNVLLVGPSGTPGAQYTSIQDAVNHAQPGDWVLVAPGVYHEHGAPIAGVLIQKSNIHLRGMNRNSVIVDGSRVSIGQRSGTMPAGSTACPSAENLQDFTPQDANGYIGQNGIEILGYSGDHDHFVGHLADDVSIENLTVCNYQKGQQAGNQIWWNGGDGKGIIGMSGFHGDYISATDTYYKKAGDPTGDYGIFTSDEGGPGVIDHSYASNMQDSSYYIGACRNCGAVLNHPYAENSALGLSSTNAGGSLLVENGVWTNNRTGLVSNAQNNDDYPSPEYGQCVPPAVPPTLGGIPVGTNSCYVIYNNKIYDNNNTNTPGTGLTSVSAIGTGVELVATQHVSVIYNQIHDNGTWGVITHDFPDPESGPAMCQGGVDVNPGTPAEVCTWFSLGNYVAANTFSGNGTISPNGTDVANQASGLTNAPTDTVGHPNDPNCFSGDNPPHGTGMTADPPTLETAPACVVGPTNSDAVALTPELVCATGAGSLFTQGAGIPFPDCAGYPHHTGVCKGSDVLTPAGDTTNGVCFAPLSRVLSASIAPPMPDPCAGVPANAFCIAAAAPTPSPSAALPLTAVGRAGRMAAVPLLLVLAVALLALPLILRRARPRS